MGRSRAFERALTESRIPRAQRRDVLRTSRGRRIRRRPMTHLATVKEHTIEPTVQTSTSLPQVLAEYAAHGGSEPGCPGPPPHVPPVTLEGIQLLGRNTNTASGESATAMESSDNNGNVSEGSTSGSDSPKPHSNVTAISSPESQLSKPLPPSPDAGNDEQESVSHIYYNCPGTVPRVSRAISASEIPERPSCPHAIRDVDSSQGGTEPDANATCQHHKKRKSCWKCRLNRVRERFLLCWVAPDQDELPDNERVVD